MVVVAACRWRVCGDVPFELVGEVARASALAEAGHVEGGAAAARHGCGGGSEVDGWVFQEVVVDGMRKVVVGLEVSATVFQLSRGRNREPSVLWSRDSDVTFQRGATALDRTWKRFGVCYST